MLTLLLGLPWATASAAEISYSWIEADYVHIDPDERGSVGGPLLRGSGEIGENFNVVAGWSRVDEGDAFDEAWYAGVGYHTHVTEQVDLFTEFAYEKQTSLGEHAYSGHIGIHAELAPVFEATAAIVYTRHQHGESDSELELEGLYKITPVWSVVAEAAIGGDEKSCLIGLRASF
jgi:hypothetical protein